MVLAATSVTSVCSRLLPFHISISDIRCGEAGACDEQRGEAGRDGWQQGEEGWPQAHRGRSTGVRE